MLVAYRRRREYLSVLATRQMLGGPTMRVTGKHVHPRALLQQIAHGRHIVDSVEPLERKERVVTGRMVLGHHHGAIVADGIARDTANARHVVGANGAARARKPLALDRGRDG